MDVEEKNFSGRKWTGLRADFEEGKNSRVAQNATEGKPKKKEKRREESTKVSRNCYGNGFTRSRWTGCQAKGARGTRRSFSKGEKRYLAVCDSNNESKPLQSPTCQTFYRGNVNAIPVCAILRRRLISYCIMTASMTLNLYRAM